MKINLEGKVALVCGASQGIGRACALAFAECGAKVYGLARSEENLDSLIREIGYMSTIKHGKVVADLSNTQKLVKSLNEILTTENIDIVVNNAGGPSPGLIQNADDEAFRLAFQQHILSAQAIAKTVLPSMKEQNYGRFINIISTSVKAPIPGLGVSNTIRAAMASWAKTLSNETAQFGVTVNSILPGFIKTKRLEQIIELRSKKEGRSKEETTQEMLSCIPAGKFGEPAEIGYLASFLASPLASYINGVTIAVDGGRTPTLS